MDDTLYDGTGLTPEPARPSEVPQTDGDGTSYEDAAPSGPAAETVTDGNEAVAVPSTASADPEEQAHAEAPTPDAPQIT